MIYTPDQYKKLSERFNSKSFLEKLIIIKNNQNIFTIQHDGYNIRLRLEESAQKLGLDLLFEFPEFFEYSHLKDMFSLVDVKCVEL